MSTHALLSASESKRWMECPGSIRYKRNLPEPPSSEFALMGTAAHMFAANCLEAGLDADFETFDGLTIDFEEGGQQYSFPIDDAMIDGVNIYLTFVRDLHATHSGDLHIERRVHLSQVADDMFGTADAIIDRPPTADKPGYFHLVDYKNGTGVVVEVKNNTQLLYYAAAYLQDRISQYDQIFVSIVQPNAPHSEGRIRTQQVSPQELIEFVEKVRIAVKRTEDPNAELKAGDWCRFCRGMAICPALRKQVQELAYLDFADDPGEGLEVAMDEDMSPEELSKLFKWLPVVKDWITTVSNEISKRMIQDKQKIPGLKVVRGRSGDRVWAHPNEEIIQLIKETFPDESSRIEFMEPPVLLSPSKMSKALAKQAKIRGAKTKIDQFLKKTGEDGLVKRAPAPLTIAQEGDPREEVIVDLSSEFDILEGDPDVPEN